jgi:ribosome-binding protein aMBF1 (putative translation factor)
MMTNTQHTRPQRPQKKSPRRGPTLADFHHGHMTPSVAADIERRRRAAGLSRRDLARAIGRSIAQLNNALRGRDTLGFIPASRLKSVFRMPGCKRDVLLYPSDPSGALNSAHVRRADGEVAA